jgi:hypothetical protein
MNRVTGFQGFRETRRKEEKGSGNQVNIYTGLHGIKLEIGHLG